MGRTAPRPASRFRGEQPTRGCSAAVSSVSLPSQDANPRTLSLGTTPFLELHRRALDASERTEHTAIARRRLEQFATPFALVEIDARVGGHFLDRGSPALGTRDGGVQRYFHVVTRRGPARVPVRWPASRRWDPYPCRTS